MPPSRFLLITGVSSGFGRALAQQALLAGHRVVGTVRNETDRQVLEALAPGRAFGRLLDVTDTAAINALVADIETNIGSIDVLVNNAGYGHEGILEESTLAELRQQFEVNVFAPAALIKAVRPGVSEVSLYGRILSAAYECGGDSLDVVLIGSTSMDHPDMPYPRHVPSGRVVEPGDVVLNEISVGYGGCSGQLIVPISVGQPTPEYEGLYRVARQALENVQAVLRPGATQDDILEAARPIADAGLVAEAPIIHGWPNPPMFPILSVGKPAETYSPQPFVLRENMLIMVEPNPTTPDLKRGVFLGALYVVTPHGGRPLQQHPLDFAVV